MGAAQSRVRDSELANDASVYTVAWGPVSADDAATVGSAYGATSRLLRLADQEPFTSLLAAVRALVPEDVLPRADDTVETLVARLSASEWLDDIHFPIGGHGKKAAARRG